MFFQYRTALLARDAVGKEMQFPPGGNPRIELAQAAGCGITRIGKHFLAGGLLPLVQGQKIGFQHQHFAAHFD